MVSRHRVGTVHPTSRYSMTATFSDSRKIKGYFSHGVSDASQREITYDYNKPPQ
jgi:hypothetical protein